MDTNYDCFYYAGKSLWKTMANKLMYIPNDDTQYYSFCRLQLVVETFGHSTY